MLRLELAELVLDRPVPHRQIPGHFSVSEPPDEFTRVSPEKYTHSFFWGGILMCHAACKNFAGLMAARFFLGVGEAAVVPGFGLITGMFYKRSEQPLR